MLYGGYTVFSVFQPVFSVSHRRAIGYHASLRAHDEESRQVASHEVFTQAARRGDLLGSAGSPNRCISATSTHSTATTNGSS